jgi:hypothetical protein
VPLLAALIQSARHGRRVLLAVMGGNGLRFGGGRGLDGLRRAVRTVLVWTVSVAMIERVERDRVA